MVQVVELTADETAEDHLWSHDHLYVDDVWQMVDEDDYVLVPDPGHHDRKKMIGRDRGGRLLTIIVTEPDEHSRARIITGWIADQEERALFAQRMGGL